MWHVFCPLCGVLLEQVSSGQSPNGVLPWIQEIRAVRSTQGASSPFLTGVGFLNDTPELIAHPDEAHRYSDSTEGWETHPLRYNSNQFWVFPFHDACWGLLLARVANGKDHSRTHAASHLFNILYCTPCDRYSIFTPGHDYDGVDQFQRPSGNVIHLMNTSRVWSYLTADPREIFEIDKSLYLSELSSQMITPTVSKLGPPSTTDMFSRLPVEVITTILTCLPSADVCNLRLSSRMVAEISESALLPQSFWASRFEQESEMGFLFAGQYPSELGKHPDWRRLYLTAKSALRDIDKRPGFRNRKRIWHALSYISSALIHLLANESKLGHQISWNDTTLLPHNGVVRPTIGRAISGELLSKNQTREELRVGCRILETKSLIWPQHVSSGGLCIAVSFVQINSRSYVSGLRVWHPNDLRGKLDISAIGLVIPSTEKTMFLENPDSLEGLEVAVTVSGIIGLRFLVQSPNGQHSHTAGDFDATIPDVGIGKLLPYNGRRLFAITVGLDACKFISMQLIECDLSEATTSPSHTDTTLSADKLQSKHNSTVIADWICAPTFPTHVTSITSVPKTPTNQIFNVHLNMDFGGPGGCLLASLRRIVAIMFGYPKIFLGLDFIYNDGRHSFYGRRSVIDDRRIKRECIEVSFPVDGAGGERVSLIEVEYFSTGQGVQSIQIYTNKGNHTIFGVYGDNTEYMNLSKSRSMLKPTEGKVITGFLAVLGVFDGSFQTFGIQSQMLWCREPPTTRQCSSIVSHALSVTHESPDTGSRIIHGRGTAYTAASLYGVRRIRVSSGATGRSRTPQHISGLWLEYYDSDGPAIVGQWITELDSWELAPSEKITEILIWSSNEFTHPQEGQAKLGRITGFSFTTSDGNSKQIFLQEDTAGQVWIKFRANRFEELGSIMWAFNSTWDHARVLYSPTPTKDGLEFIFLTHEPPSWVVPEKLLWQDCDLNGNCSTVASIQVSFISGAISGISFTYTSGITRTLGSQEGDTSTMHVESDEELTRMDIGFHYVNRIQFVSFYTNYGRQMTRDARLPLEPWVQSLGAVRTSNSDCVFGLHPLSNVTSTNSGSEVYEFPSGAKSFVGLWGMTGRRERRIIRLGPIFTGPSRGAEDGF